MSKSVAGVIKFGNKFMLGKRKSGGSIGGKWEFIGGKVEKDEPLQTALEREFLEELNVKILVNDFIIEKKFKSNDHSFTLFAYYVEMLNEKIEYIEHDEFKYFTIDEIKELGNKLADSDKLIIDYL